MDAKQKRSKVAADLAVMPQFRKSHSLDPVGEGGTGNMGVYYNFYGPPADSGMSYASYKCEGCGEQSIMNNGISVFCPSCGKPVFAQKDIEYNEVKSMALSEIGTCPQCETKLVTSANLDKAGKLFCPQCSSEISVTKAETVNEETTLTNEDNMQQTKIIPLIDKIEGAIESQDLDMHLYGDNKPFWNLVVKGMPYAAIHLEDQPQPEQLQAYFISDSFKENFKKAVAKYGVSEVTKNMPCRVFANQFMQSALVEIVRKDVIATIETERKQKLLSLKDRLLKCISMTITGADKNYFSDFENPIKLSLYAHLTEAGVYDPVNVIEDIQKNSIGDYFSRVMTKACDLMGKSDEFLTDLEKAIGSAGIISVQQIETNASLKEAKPFAKHLAEGNFNYVPTEATYSGNNVKENLRKKLFNK